MFPSPPVAHDDPFRAEKLLSREAHAKLDAKRSEQWDLPDELDRLLSGENPDDAATLARVKAIRKRLAVLPAEIEAAADAAKLADARLAPARAAQYQADLDQARRELRALDAERERAVQEYREALAKAVALEQRLADPTFHIKRFELAKRAGLP
jgi:paraquat-inducible protein B